jgi:hypothetical protein
MMSATGLLICNARTVVAYNHHEAAAMPIIYGSQKDFSTRGMNHDVPRYF